MSAGFISSLVVLYRFLTYEVDVIISRNDFPIIMVASVLISLLYAFAESVSDEEMFDIQTAYGRQLQPRSYMIGRNDTIEFY
jgi:hypothetical protein